MDTYKLLIAGDVMLDKDTSKDRKCAIASLKDLCNVLGINAAICDLEIPLTERGYPSDKLIAWRASPFVAQDLKEMGFTCISLANNHICDYGIDGLLDTLEALRSQKILCVGAGRNLKEALAPAVIQVAKGTTLAVFSVSCTLPKNSAASEKRPGAAPIRIHTSYEIDSGRLDEGPGSLPHVHSEVYEEDLERVCEAITRSKQKGWLTIVLLHWGIGMQNQLTEYQQTLARRLVASGCDLIIGGHAHTIQAIEVIDGVPVFYCLGNFLVDSKLMNAAFKNLSPDAVALVRQMSSQSLIVTLEFTKDRRVSLEIMPVALHDDGVPYLVDRKRAQQILREVEDLSKKPLSWSVKGGKGYIQL